MATNNSQVRYYITATDKTGAAWRSANGRVQRHRKLLGGLQAPIKRAKLALVQFNAAIGGIAVGAIAGLTASFGALGKAVFTTGMKMDAFMNSMIVSTGSISSAKQEIAKIKNLTDTLGLNFLSTADAYKKFSIAAKEVGMAGATSDKVFRSVAKASAAMGLSAENTRLTLKALEQMISKGTVQSEELRGQLGEHLPGAFGMAAQAMKITTMQLSKMLEQGEILAIDLLPKLADVLENKFASVAVRASTQARASFERMKNAWVDFLVVFGQTGVYGQIEDAIKGITARFKELVTFIKAGELARILSAIQIELELIEIGFQEMKVSALSFAKDTMASWMKLSKSTGWIDTIQVAFLNVIDTALLAMETLSRAVSLFAKVMADEFGFLAKHTKHWAGVFAEVAGNAYEMATILGKRLVDALDGANSSMKKIEGGTEEYNNALSDTIDVATTFLGAQRKLIAEQKESIGSDAKKLKKLQEMEDSYNSLVKSVNEAEKHLALLRESFKVGGFINQAKHALWEYDQELQNHQNIMKEMGKEGFGGFNFDEEVLGGSLEKPKSLQFFDDFNNKRFMTEMREMSRETKDITQLSADFIDGFSTGITDELAEALATGKMDFADFARSILMDINKMIIKMLVFKAIMGVVNVVGGMFGGAAAGAPGASQAVGGLGQSLNSVAVAGAGSGAVMASGFESAMGIGGNMPIDFSGAFAKGGSVSGGRAIIVGEQGREVFVPDSDGQIIPNHNINKTSSGQGSESGDTINVTLNLSTGVQQTVRAEVMGMMPVITKQVKGAVAEARQRGGSFSSQMGVA